MGRVDEEHVTFTGLGGGQDRLQFGLEKSGSGLQRARPSFFLAARGSHGPVSLQAHIFTGSCAAAGPRRNPVS